MKIAIVGSREFSNEREALDRIHEILKTEFKEGDTLVSGGARGVDKWAETLAKDLGVPTKIYLPDWDRYGKGAAFIRNKQIVDNCDRVIAVWNGTSKGTANTIYLANKKGIPVSIILIKE